MEKIRKIIWKKDKEKDKEKYMGDKRKTFMQTMNTGLHQAKT